MNGWAVIWLGFAGVALTGFFVLAVVVSFKAAGDLRRLFEDFRRGETSSDR